MNEILHTLWQINYKRDNPVTLTILHVYSNHDIAGTINHSSTNPLSFSNYRECINLLETFEKGILT
jgi:hypothetical protein